MQICSSTAMTVTISRKCLLSRHYSIPSQDSTNSLMTSSSLKSNYFSTMISDRCLYAFMMCSIPNIYSRAILKFYSSDWLLK